MHIFNYKLTAETLKSLKPLIAFGTIGAINTVISFSLFTLFWKILHINYLVATSCTYIITAIIQFFGNRKMTFKCSSGNLFVQILKYLTLLAINYCITLFMVNFSVSVLGVSPYIGMCMAISCTAVIGFLLFKFWVFRYSPLPASQ